MSIETGICVQDLASTLQQLNLFLFLNSKHRKQPKVLINLNSPQIDEHMGRLAKIPQEKRDMLKLDKLCLIWSPYISYHLMQAANLAQEAIKLVDKDVQVDSGSFDKDYNDFLSKELANRFDYERFYAQFNAVNARKKRGRKRKRFMRTSIKRDPVARSALVKSKMEREKKKKAAENDESNQLKQEKNMVSKKQKFVFAEISLLLFDFSESIYFTWYFKSYSIY
jgi:hypothetical protein